MAKLKGLLEGYSWVDEITNKVIIELKKTSDILEELHSQFFSRYGISNTKFNVLAILYNGPMEGMILSEISELMLVTKGNMTGLIDRLEKQGFVERIRDDDDRRKISAVITEEGRVFTQMVIEDYKRWTKEILVDIKMEEKNELILTLKKIQNGIVIAHHYKEGDQENEVF
ncbi:MarR family 2-MHQ and catechol resistance regulon transcriptional repressor [Anaerosolibacter carboniphilus]|uniref:MarR family 2-MHQ and catechol resistance regulon transcriptional repressor n=1 Tax=Anaerosolibacter carboniphilus TaxID=1417629 RepID=A0A841L1S2_9FIRM|nr:MarR family transcriptional regulator [Anaerosolibacter carboniphilus]MBB6217112.1 MarR family 2-MHQ and catechol resistance regulon transcriptional repressor [Anaerosolibacter carboniphilus]